MASDANKAHFATRREYFDKQLGALDTERSGFISHYKSLSQFVSPRRGRFLEGDRNKGDPSKWNSIINNHASWAHGVARSGMFAGTMSPSRPWFALETLDVDMMEFRPVKVWLKSVERIIYDIFAASNFYTMAPQVLGELLLFGTGAMSQVDDFDTVTRFYTHTAGSYYIAQNDKFEVDTLVRKYDMTVSQMVGAFGVDAVPPMVKDSYDRGDYHGWHPVVHFIEPNPDSEPSRAGGKFKKFRSVKYAVGESDKNKFLSESGFDEFPAYVPRWDVTDEDVYGTSCPAMVALGDTKQLQVQEKRKAQGIDKLVNPPLRGPASIRDKAVSALPGGLNIYDGSQHGTKLEPVYTVDPKLQDMHMDIKGVERRIDGAFMVDMFLAISRMEGVQPKNELELAKRDGERLLQLGPVLQRVHGEWLDKVVDRVFAQIVAAGLLPPPPPEIAGQPLRTKYISALAQAQRAVAGETIEQVSGFISGLMQAGFVDAGDKFDAAQAVDEYASVHGAPPRMIRSDEEAAQLAQARQQQQQMAQMAALGEQAAGAASDAGSAVASVAGATRGR